MTHELHDTNPVLVEVPMPIITPRLILRPPQAGDGEAMFAAKSESWPELKSWMPWAQTPEDHSAEKDEIMCRTQYAKYLLREDLMMLAFERINGQMSGKMIAGSGLHRMDWRARLFEIGYWVRSDETGKGYASEITNALLRYAFYALSANRVYICHDSENSRSRRVIEKCGFIKEGESKLNDTLGGRLRGTCHYARYDLDGLLPLDVTWGAEAMP